MGINYVMTDYTLILKYMKVGEMPQWMKKHVVILTSV